MREVDRIVSLIRKYLEDQEKYSSDEEFISLLEEYPFLRDLLEDFSSFEDLTAAIETYQGLDESDDREDRMWRRVANGIQLHDRTDRTEKRKVIPYRYYLSAACILLLATFGIWLFQSLQKEQVAPPLESIVSFEPGKNQAILESPLGETISLSSSYEGIVVDGKLSYDDGTEVLGTAVDEASDTYMYTLSTPKGGQYQITLSDGTKVWLNADSKLKYPNRFSSSERFVELQGEAYFEVAENKKSPFIVKTDNETVRVLGTHFNVNAYKNEEVSHVSLFEGSVKVSIGNDFSEIIKPGQQSVVKKGGISVQSADLEEVLAWKNGEFIFNHESLKSAMQKVARWYDLDIEVSSKLQDISIWGSVSRYDNFNKVLEIIKMTDETIRYESEGRRVEFMK